MMERPTHSNFIFQEPLSLQAIQVIILTWLHVPLVLGKYEKTLDFTLILVWNTRVMYPMTSWFHQKRTMYLFHNLRICVRS